MKSTLIWIILGGAILLFNGKVDAWNRQFFNRYSRNLFQNGDLVGNAAAGGIPTNNEIDEFNALFGLDGGGGVSGGGGVGGGGAVGFNDAADISGINNERANSRRQQATNLIGMNGGIGVGGLGQQQPEVYGIVEPLIEDLPCVDRPCSSNEECCPGGVCIFAYGDKKCIYDYGRKRDLCHRHVDCEPGLSCLKGTAGNFFCQPITSSTLGTAAVVAAKTAQVKQFGEDCVTSSDCNVNKGMCCQLQRSHHRMLPRKICAFFRDPFMCIDILPNEDEDIRESRFLTSFSQRLM